MNQERIERRLSGILIADVAGYSRLMEDNEEWTIRNLEENKKVMEEFISDFQGRVVDSPGDNILAEFSSVVNAVECAILIQKELASKYASLPENKRMQFRIGINLGDVIIKDNSIYGDGVNAAARIQSLADPGGINISRAVYDQVKRKIDIQYDYLGEHQVKNLDEPVRIYRIIPGGKQGGQDTIAKPPEKASFNRMA